MHVLNQNIYKYLDLLNSIYSLYNNEIDNYNNEPNFIIDKYPYLLFFSKI